MYSSLFQKKIPHSLKPGELISPPFAPRGLWIFVSGSIFPSFHRVGIHHLQKGDEIPKLCRVREMSKGGEFSPPSVYYPITGWLTKSLDKINLHV